MAKHKLKEAHQLVDQIVSLSNKIEAVDKEDYKELLSKLNLFTDKLNKIDSSFLNVVKSTSVDSELRPMLNTIVEHIQGIFAAAKQVREKVQSMVPVRKYRFIPTRSEE